MSERLLKAEDVAALLGVPKSWVYSASAKGELPVVKLGHYCRYRPEAIQRWIEEREESGVTR